MKFSSVTVYYIYYDKIIFVIIKFLIIYKISCSIFVRFLRVIHVGFDLLTFLYGSYGLLPFWVY